MDLGIRGRVALVSGGSKGIGREIAGQLAAEGVRVVIAARGAAALDAAAGELRSAGHEVDAVRADMSDQSQIRAAVEFAVERFGAVDIAVSNVYPHHTGGFETTTDDDFRSEFDTMVMSVVHLVRAVLPGMKERRWGRLVNIGSITMRGPIYGFPMILSHFARPAVVGLNRSLANEVGEFGITVNNIAVGSIKTDRAVDSFQKRTRQEVASFDELEAARVKELGIPLRRMGTAAELASAAVYLCSTQAGYITGQTLVVDGGRSGGLY